VLAFLILVKLSNFHPWHKKVVGHLLACFNRKSNLGINGFSLPSILEQTLHLIEVTNPSLLIANSTHGNHATQTS
jgi:hypothetical protein